MSDGDSHSIGGALRKVVGEPAPTPAETPRAKKKQRAGMTEHEHLIDLDRAFVKVTEVGERTERKVERLEVMLELICEHLGLHVPERVR